MRRLGRRILLVRQRDKMSTSPSSNRFRDIQHTQLEVEECASTAMLFQERRSWALCANFYARGLCECPHRVGVQLRRSPDSLINKIPALDTVAGVAFFKELISNTIRIASLSGTRSLDTSVSTCRDGNRQVKRRNTASRLHVGERKPGLPKLNKLCAGHSMRHS